MENGTTVGIQNVVKPFIEINSEFPLTHEILMHLEMKATNNPGVL